MGGKPRQARTLSDSWRQWVRDALGGGASTATVVAGLLEEGVPAKIADREVELIDWVLRKDHRVRRADLALRLWETCSRGWDIERRTLCGRDEFNRRYASTSTPVVFTNGCEPLGVVGKWTPAYLAHRGGDAPMKVSLGRDGAPKHYADPERFYTELPVNEIVDRVLAAGNSNDLYVVSRNRASQGPLSCLADDFEALPAFLDPDPRRGGWSMWFGPAGTETPLHHDTTPILFCQIYGRKRLFLAAPSERELLYGPLDTTFYSTLDLEHADVDIRTVDVGPGEAVFLPVGWWHGVRALDVSISLSLTGFRPYRDFDWYRPGSA